MYIPDILLRSIDLTEIDIWKCFDGKYKVHCPTREIYKQMIRWKDARHGGTYHMPDGTREYDVIIPEIYYDRAVKLLTQYFESLTQNSDTKPVLKDNDLQESKSSVSKEKMGQSKISLRSVIRRPAEKSRC